jgi:hypothetical protein
MKFINLSNITEKDAVSYAFKKLEICIELLMKIDAKGIGMSSTDFDL